jgi:hypothetical protein
MNGIPKVHPIDDNKRRASYNVREGRRTTKFYIAFDSNDPGNGHLNSVYFAIYPNPVTL